MHSRLVYRLLVIFLLLYANCIEERIFLFWGDTMNYQWRITLFTPTYNRAYIIERLYRSIQHQTYRNFEWIIIDDGSTDNTEIIVNQWINDNNDFPIRYYKVENGGKCRAINRAVQLASGEIFFTIDSDDYLTDDACEKINEWMESIRECKDFCGIVANRGQSPTKTRNTTWRDNSNSPWYNQPYRDATFFERYPETTDYPIDGERAEAFWTDIIKRYPYPEFQGEKFMTECITWNRMARDGYKIRVFEDIIWVWEYLDDGLTKKGGNSLFIDNPRGHFLWMKEKAKFLNYSFKERMKLYYGFYCEYHNTLTISQISKYSHTPIVYYVLFSAVFNLKH